MQLQKSSHKLPPKIALVGYQHYTVGGMQSPPIEPDFFLEDLTSDSDSDNWNMSKSGLFVQFYQEISLAKIFDQFF